MRSHHFAIPAPPEDNGIWPITTNANSATDKSEVEQKYMYAAGNKREKIWNRFQAREGMQSVPNAGKHGTSAKCRKTCNRCQVRENMKAMPSEENTQPMPSVGKHATGVK